MDKKTIKIEDIYKKEIDELEVIEKYAFVLDALNFLEDNNFHTHVEVIGKLFEGFSIKNLESQINLEY